MPSRALCALAIIGSLAARAHPAHAAGEPLCRVVDLQLLPTDGLQVVAWIEDRSGNYVDTVFITRTTGTYGLGNRPGIMEFNSGPWWPYGRRTTTFPIWAHRHGMSFPMVLFQDGHDDNLSHPLAQSSHEVTFCRPILPTEPLWDAQSCATTVYTDKGVLSQDQVSLYPPRRDIAFDPNHDDPSVEAMADLNPFDSVSHATPAGGIPYETSWAVPFDLPNDDYTMWIEVSREFDQNEAYDYPAPTGIPWKEYGEPYRGQPSLVYRVDFSLADSMTEAMTLDYVGYGDPDGVDGAIRPADDTITTGTEGSGAMRLMVLNDGAQDYRIRLQAYPSPDEAAPDAAGDVAVDELRSTSVSARFIAPGDDGMSGTVAGYEVRYVAAGTLDPARFDDATEATFQLDPVAGGEEQTIEVTDLLPRTSYSIGVRAFDECRNTGPVTTFEITTPRTEAGSVDACFVATAAYGSLLAADVVALRGFRDAALRTHLTGELAVEAYYTFGPLLARVIAPSATLRRTARAALAPLVSRVRAAGF